MLRIFAQFNSRQATPHHADMGAAQEAQLGALLELTQSRSGHAKFKSLGFTTSIGP
jgi:hypothetical protein